jgi:hypothetical protein
MRLYTLTILDQFSGDFIDSIPFQTPYPIDMAMVDYDELVQSLGYGFNTGLHEIIITDNGLIAEIPVVEF